MGRRKRSTDPEDVKERERRAALIDSVTKRESTKREIAGEMVIGDDPNAPCGWRSLAAEEARELMRAPAPGWARFDVLRAPGRGARMVRKIRGQVVWLWRVPDDIHKPWEPRWRVRLEQGYTWAYLLQLGFERVGRYVPAVQEDASEIGAINPPPP